MRWYTVMMFQFEGNVNSRPNFMLVLLSVTIHIRIISRPLLSSSITFHKIWIRASSYFRFQPLCITLTYKSKYALT